MYIYPPETPELEQQSAGLRSMARYLKLILRRTASETWQTIGLNRQTIFAVLIYAALLALFWLRGGRDAIVSELTTWVKLVLEPTLIAVGILLVLSVVKAAHSIHEEQTQEIFQYRELNKPKLKIFFDKNDPNCVDLNYVPTGQHVVSTYRIFRVGITNVGGYVLNNVSAKADYEWEGSSFSAIPLHEMHDESWLIRGRHLNPDETLYLDVVMMKESAQDAKFSRKQTEIRLCHIKPKVVRSEIGRGGHAIPVVASGQATPPERRMFRAWVDDWDRLQFEEADQSASSQNVGSIPSS
jgi:hypothetical protein